MSGDDAIVRDVIAKLKRLAGENGIVTSEDLAAAIEHLSNETFGIAAEAIIAALEGEGIKWRDPNSGPPIFPSGYAGPTLVKNEAKPSGS